jgi:hypothetical protein
LLFVLAWPHQLMWLSFLGDLSAIVRQKADEV